MSSCPGSVGAHPVRERTCIGVTAFAHRVRSYVDLWIGMVPQMQGDH